MATIGHDGAAQTLPGSGAKRSHFTAEVFIDFAVIAGDVTIGTTDTVQALKLLKGTTILAAGVEVLKVEGTNTTAKIECGDGDDPNRYVAAAVLTSLGGMTPTATARAHTFVADDTIDLLISVDDPTDAQVRVWADCVGSYQTGPMTATTQIDAKTYS
jgi:hypothetical protein